MKPASANPTSAIRSTGNGRSGRCDPCVIVIFGATGDLTKRKLMPALYHLGQEGLLSERFAVVGISNVEMDSAGFREDLSKEVATFADEPVNKEVWDRLGEHLYYTTGDFHDPAAYAKLKDLLAGVDKAVGTPGNYLFYLATAPVFFGEICEQLAASGLAAEPQGRWRRVIIEKPFGHDLDSALALNRQIKKVLAEPQIYRIDHYMGKETVQNLMVFRFGNGIFEPVWNRRYIDHVQITAAETVGVEERAGYYDSAGALRDMVPNHIFQLVSLIAMEPPNSFEAEAVRDEKSKVLHAMQAPTPEQVLTMAVRGQYDHGEIEDEAVAAYRSEQGVKPDSTTETFVALKLAIDNWRWAEVPFYVRTGKRMAGRVTEVAITFKRPPLLLFRDTSVERLLPNQFVMQIQPEESISLRFGAKIPGPAVEIGAVEMKFRYSEYFGATPSTGYETLLRDAMVGDPTLFQRADMSEIAWSVVTPILDVWKTLPPRNFPNYASGSTGPRESDDLLARDGRAWRPIL